jgi:hypothetical protein
MKFFDAFAEHPFGAWVVQGVAVLAFIIAIKILASRLPDSGPAGAIKAGINVV